MLRVFNVSLHVPAQRHHNAVHRRNALGYKSIGQGADSRGLQAHRGVVCPPANLHATMTLRVAFGVLNRLH